MSWIERFILGFSALTASAILFGLMVQIFEGAWWATKEAAMFSSVLVGVYFYCEGWKHE